MTTGRRIATTRRTATRQSPRRRRMYSSRSKRLLLRPRAQTPLVGRLVKIIIALLVVGAIAWAVTTWNRLQAHVKPLAENTSHAFIVSKAKNPTLLVIRQGAAPASLETLLVVRADPSRHKIATLSLPVNLSDGQTTAGQYLESGYYKELQQMVEKTIALPLDGYLIDKRIDKGPATHSWTSYLEHQPVPSWWDTTVALPQWLNSLDTVRTSLTPTQTLQLTWQVRDLADLTTITPVPASAQITTNGMVTLDQNAVDPLVTQVFVDQLSKDQGISVVIKNATDVNGLAGQMSRYIQHMGGEVVAVEPSDSGQTRSSMSAATSTKLSNAITDFLGIPLTQTQPTGRERADMELNLGEDVLTRLGIN